MLNRFDQGVVFMFFSAMLSALNGACAKFLSLHMDPMEIVFYRNFLGILIILYTFKKLSVPFDTSKVHLLLLRGIFGALAMVMFFYTIATIPLGVAIVLNKTSPFFVTILAYYLVKETINIYTFFALLIGFIGVVFIVKPFDMSISYEHIIGILGGFFAAAAYATIKKIKDIYDARIIMLSFMGIGIIIPILIYLLSPEVHFKLHTNPIVWTVIVLMALISTVSQWLLTRAYSLSKASIIGVIGYTTVPFGIGFGLVLGDGLPDFYTIIGILLIIIGGILVSKK